MIHGINESRKEKANMEGIAVSIRGRLLQWYSHARRKDERKI